MNCIAFSPNGKQLASGGELIPFVYHVQGFNPDLHVHV